MNPEEKKVYQAICSYKRPVSPRELRAKLKDADSFQKAIWKLVDINKIEFTVDSKLQPKIGRIVAKKVEPKLNRGLRVSSCLR